MSEGVEGIEELYPEPSVQDHQSETRKTTLMETNEETIVFPCLCGRCSSCLAELAEMAEENARLSAESVSDG